MYAGAHRYVPDGDYKDLGEYERIIGVTVTPDLSYIGLRLMHLDDRKRAEKEARTHRVMGTEETVRSSTDDTNPGYHNRHRVSFHFTKN